MHTHHVSRARVSDPFGWVGFGDTKKMMSLKMAMGVLLVGWVVAIRLVAAQQLPGLRLGHPEHVRCDLGAYFYNMPVWTNPRSPYVGNLPAMPEDLLSRCPECEWDTIEKTPVCDALKKGVAYEDGGGGAGVGLDRMGMCRFYPRLHAPGDTLSEDAIASAESGIPMEKFLPYFHVCSGNPAHHTQNTIFYDFTGRTVAVTDPMQKLRASLSFSSQSAGHRGTGVEFSDRREGRAVLDCTAFVGKPDDPWDIFAEDIKTSVFAMNATTKEQLDVGIINTRIVRQADAGMCPHANYAMSAEIAAYPYTASATETPEDDVPLARDFWVTRIVTDRAAPMISGIPSQPAHLPQQVSCAHDAMYWTLTAAPKIFNPKITATDACAGAVPVTYDVEWSGLPGEELTCPDRGTVMMRWRAHDECGNTATASHAVRVYDDSAPYIPEPVDGILKVCIVRDEIESGTATSATTTAEERKYWMQAAQTSRRRMCLDKLLREHVARESRDNCAPIGMPPDQVEFDWALADVEQCEASTALAIPGKPRTLQSCVKIGGHTMQATTSRPSGCFIAQDGKSIVNNWTRITVPVKIWDACGNLAPRYTVTVVVAPSERICNSYGHRYIVYKV